ncbi:MAG: OmpA family protein [Bacteroidetes bacterium]|nr:OmpA family protein [Bacteroidota bacterium]MBU1484048.1 OmpA family protein [Bacteroidota bacterium]MBU2045158.1 OmpA family protein [Bacteroidota bacterium]MBU2267076.1 OmpA family protein [Bacteroidota bacterium]MBU2374991.1 OmpA family protein [Bacteroidota bacterium]
MKKTVKFLIILSLFVQLIPPVCAQSQKDDKKLSSAISSYNSLKFVEAIEILKPILAKDPDNVDAAEMIANSYRLTKQYKESLNWYEKLCKQSYLKPDWVLRYAEALANNKQYEKSEQWYRKYLNIVPSDKRAALFSEADFDKLGKGVNWDINFLNINTPSSEYGPMLYKDGLIFSSNRLDDKTVKYVFGWNNTPFSDLYMIKDRKNIKPIIDTLQDAVKNINISRKGAKYNDDNTAVTANDTKIIGTYALNTKTSLEESDKQIGITKLNNKINSKYHEAITALLPDGSLMFTRNNYYKWRSNSSSEGINKLKLYTAEGFDWRKIKPFEYNNDEYSVGHPTISKDGNILVFASDMPGGLGGVDLYFSIRLNDKSPWSRPVNFGGKVNSEGDEEFPYFDNFNRLYFSSNGWPGLGGLDVFYVDIDNLKPITNPINLGPPLNSSFDDFAIAKEDDSTGYFSSNRKGSDDIYSFKKKVFKIFLKGRVLDFATGKILYNATVNLKNGDNEEILKLGDDGVFNKELSKNNGYELDATLKDYLTDRKYVGTDGITKDTTIQIDLYLKKTNKSEQYLIENCDSLKKKFFVGNIYYDLDKYYIRPDAHQNLDKLADMMKQYPDLKVLTRSHCDSRASEGYNRVLSLNRGESAKAYLVDLGIDKNRISVEYFGKSRLVNGCEDGVNCNEAQQQMNRRTEFEMIYNGINLSLIECK